MGSTQSSSIGLCCLSRHEDIQVNDQSQLLTNKSKRSHSNHDVGNELVVDQLSPPVKNEEIIKTAPSSPIKAIFNSGIDNQHQSLTGTKYSFSSISSKSSTDQGIDEILGERGRIEQRNDDEELISRLEYGRGREHEEELRVAQSSLDEAATEALNNYYDTSRRDRDDDIDEASLRYGDDAEERDDCMKATM